METSFADGWPCVLRFCNASAVTSAIGFGSRRRVTGLPTGQAGTIGAATLKVERWQALEGEVFYDEFTEVIACN